MQKSNNNVTFSRLAAYFLPPAVLLGAVFLVGQTVCQPQIVEKKPLYLLTGGQVPTTIEEETAPTPYLHNEVKEYAKSTKKAAFRDTVQVYDAARDEIRTMATEDYVLGVVLAEMPLSFGAEALKAQAVAARTMAVYCQTVEQGKHADCDICTDHRHCQSYVDPALAEYDISAAKNAVEQTRGMIAVYDGQPILAAYHASSGEATRSAKDVWGSELSYLVPVFAPENMARNGHGVGMSQYGAKALAESGYDYIGILQYYYAGVSLGFL